MSTLNEVQREVVRQLVNNFSDRSLTEVRAMVHFGLAEEAGEVVGLMKRVLRKFPKDTERTTTTNFIEELGDVLWYLAACCYVNGTTLDEIWLRNIEKVKERYGE